MCITFVCARQILYVAIVKNSKKIFVIFFIFYFLSPLFHHHFLHRIAELQDVEPLGQDYCGRAIHVRCLDDLTKHVGDGQIPRPLYGELTF